jgi:hypothetical protein
MVSARHIFPITAPDRTLNAATAVGICRSKPDRACRCSRRRAAFPEILGFAQRAPGDLPSDDDAAQKWIFHARNFHLMFRSKNQARNHSRGPTYTARGVHPTALPSRFLLPRRKEMSNYRQHRRTISARAVSATSGSILQLDNNRQIDHPSAIQTAAKATSFRNRKRR